MVNGLTLHPTSHDCLLYVTEATLSGELVIEVDLLVEPGDSLCLVSGHVVGEFTTLELTGISCLDGYLEYGQSSVSLVLDGSTCSAARPSL